ncbi:MAG: hydrolase [marine bacterium B5-7]|nr:MAG: hydrolase [marine bacterium B5-7]
MILMLIDSLQSTVLIIDLQERLAPTIHQIDQVLSEIIWLINLAARFDVPVIATEQYPKGLGPTVPEVATKIANDHIVEKIAFSASADGGLERIIQGNRRQVIIAGMEAHVCVLQSALDLIQQGFEVFIVAGAVGSRRPDDRTLGLDRMRQEGCRIVSREMIAFEWLGRAGTDLFRSISREFLR